MIKGTTQSDFAFEVDPIILKDAEWLDMLAELDEKPYKIGKFVEYSLGIEQKKALYDHLRKDGRVMTDDVNDEFTEILNIIGEQDTDVKN